MNVLKRIGFAGAYVALNIAAALGVLVYAIVIVVGRALPLSRGLDRREGDV